MPKINFVLIEGADAKPIDQAYVQRLLSDAYQVLSRNTLPTETNQIAILSCGDESIKKITTERVAVIGECDTGGIKIDQHFPADASADSVIDWIVATEDGSEDEDLSVMGGDRS